MKEDLYIYPPSGFEHPDKVLKLKKALYGLKQAPLCWNRKFTEFLQKLNFKQLENENCIFRNKRNSLILGIYVDDGIILGSNESEIEELLNDLKAEYKITIVKQPTNYVGFQIEIEDDTIKLKQTSYLEKVLDKTGMTHSKSVKIPLIPGETNDLEDQTKDSNYKEIVGSLLYASTKTRPDIAFAVNYCSRYVNEPKIEKCE